jgi:hypothetical protein
MPLQRNTVLDAAAQQKAQHMAKNEYFSHFSPTGVSPWHWFDEAGYVYAHAGENLAIHFTDSSEVVEAWMDSPTHRENIVDGKYTEIGVGTAKGTYEGYDTVYVVQLFGAPGIAAPAEVAPAAPAVVAEQVQVESSPEPVAASVPAQTQVLPPQPPVEVESDSSMEIAANEPVSEAVSEVSPASRDQASVAVVPPDVSAMPAPEQPAAGEEIVTVERPLLATSSGLAIANITQPNPPHAGATSFISFATKPNALLQFVYLGLGLCVFLLLTASLVMEARQLRFVQAAYSVLLLFGMGGLWFLNSLLTSGAVIV